MRTCELLGSRSNTLRSHSCQRPLDVNPVCSGSRALGRCLALCCSLLRGRGAPGTGRRKSVHSARWPPAQTPIRSDPSLPGHPGSQAAEEGCMKLGTITAEFQTRVNSSGDRDQLIWFRQHVLTRFIIAAVKLSRGPISTSAAVKWPHCPPMWEAGTTARTFICSTWAEKEAKAKISQEGKNNYKKMLGKHPLGSKNELWWIDRDWMFPLDGYRY